MKKKLAEIFSCNVRLLALFRIGLALTIIVDLILRSTDLTAHYTDQGILPRALLIKEFSNPWHASIHLANGTALFQAFLFAGAAVFAFMLLLGWRTRLATLLSWLFLVSLHSRNPKILGGGDLFLGCLLFWSLFVPLARRYSLDQSSKASSDLPERVSGVGTAGFLLQVAFVYFFSFLHKWNIDLWRSGEGLRASLSYEPYTTQIGLALLNYPHLLKFLNFAVLALEAAIPLLLLSPFFTRQIRILMILLMGGLQLAFSLCFTLGNFPWVSMLAMIPFWLPLSSSQAIEDETMVSRILASFFLICILLWNLESAFPAFKMPTSFHQMSRGLRLSQEWKMYMNPSDKNGWYVIPGRLASGEVIDLLRRGKTVGFERPRLLSALYKNHRWRKYMRGLRKDRNSIYRRYFAHYLCRDWNAGHRGKDRLEETTIYFMLEKQKKIGAERIKLWSGSCGKAMS